MNGFYYRPIIEEIKNHQCSTEEVIFLIKLYARIVQNVAGTKLKEACYNLADFHDTKVNYVDQFSLRVKCKEINGQEQWRGMFRDCHKKLKVIATLIDEW